MVILIQEYHFVSKVSPTTHVGIECFEKVKSNMCFLYALFHPQLIFKRIYYVQILEYIKKMKPLVLLLMFNFDKTWIKTYNRLYYWMLISTVNWNDNHNSFLLVIVVVLVCDSLFLALMWEKMWKCDNFIEPFFICKFSNPINNFSIVTVHKV